MSLESQIKSLPLLRNMLIKENLGMDPTELHVVRAWLGPEFIRSNVLGVFYLHEFISIKVEVVIWLIREL